MIEVGKYYKFKDNELVVKALSPENEGTFYGEVVVAVKGYAGELTCDVAYFVLCEAPQSIERAQPEPTHAKDTELRLECLKLAVEANSVDPVIVAKEYYEWITKPQ